MDSFGGGCSGSMFCPACGGVCFLDTVADRYPYTRGLRARMQEETMEPDPDDTQPTDPPPPDPPVVPDSSIGTPSRNSAALDSPPEPGDAA